MTDEQFKEMNKMISREMVEKKPTKRVTVEKKPAKRMMRKQ